MKVQAHPFDCSGNKTPTFCDHDPRSWPSFTPSKHAHSSQCLARESSVEDGIECRIGSCFESFKA